jgi:hypothetical protein
MRCVDDFSTVVERVRRNILGLTSEWPVLQRLTGGRDSRMLLACARPFADRITFFTAEHERSNQRSWLDCNAGSRIARDLGLRYLRLARLEPKPEDLDEWLARTGWSVGEEMGRQACTTFKALPAGHADLVGMGGEFGRAQQWPAEKPDYWPGDATRPEPSLDNLLSFFLNLYFPLYGGRHPLSRSTVAEWLETVRSYDPYFIIDLFYIEQRLGTWGGVFPYAFANDGRFQLFPFSHREIFEALVSLPKSTRLDDDLTHQLIKREWPALLAYPFNRPQGVQRVTAVHFSAYRFAQRARRAAPNPVRTTRRVAARASQILL